MVIVRLANTATSSSDGVLSGNGSSKDREESECDSHLEVGDVVLRATVKRRTCVLGYEIRENAWWKEVGNNRETMFICRLALRAGEYASRAQSQGRGTPWQRTCRYSSCRKPAVKSIWLAESRRRPGGVTEEGL